ncbi:hypothetical protein HZB90_04115, partial [archaeon]|nr:hypothetical protein [archaeon]
GNPNDVILYRGRMFEVHPAMLDYLASQPGTLNARIDRAMRNGMAIMDTDGAYGCTHYAQNLGALLAESGGRMVIHNVKENLDNSIKGCKYERTDDLKWARAVRSRGTGKIVMAQRNPCVVEDAKVTVLADNGLLDECEVQGREFNYPTVAQLIADPALADRYEVKTQPMPPSAAAQTAGGKLSGLMKKLFS